MACGERVERYGHNLERLFDAYHRCYQDPSFALQLPARFQVTPTEDIFPELMNEFHDTLDQRHRYAADRKGNSFAAPEVFDPTVVLQELEELSRDLLVLEWAKIRPLFGGSECALTLPPRCFR
jgi:hypothetical protein